MDDIVDRLRQVAGFRSDGDAHIMGLAAAEIRRLRSAPAGKMAEALREIADLKMGRGDGVVGDYIEDVQDTATAALAAWEAAPEPAQDQAWELRIASRHAAFEDAMQIVDAIRAKSRRRLDDSWQEACHSILTGIEALQSKEVMALKASRAKSPDAGRDGCEQREPVPNAAGGEEKP